LVYNKVDALAQSQQPRQVVDALERVPGVRTPRVFVSALQGQGLDALRDLIAQAASGADAAADQTMQDAAVAPHDDASLPSPSEPAARDDDHPPRSMQA
jgi:GTP-binding protein HflX